MVHDLSTQKGRNNYVNSFQTKVKARLQNGLFLKVTISEEIYLAWFPFWATLGKEYREDLRKLDKSVIAVENQSNGKSKSIEINDNSLMGKWSQNKSNKECREALIRAVHILISQGEL